MRIYVVIVYINIGQMLDLMTLRGVHAQVWEHLSKKIIKHIKPITIKKIGPNLVPALILTNP